MGRVQCVRAGDARRSICSSSTRRRTRSGREAAAWSAVWVALAVLFGAGVYTFMGREAGLEYFAGYLIEKALSVDNIFVFVLIFSFFRVPARYQHRVLFWGILGALLMRGAMIAAGAYLIQQFHWIIYVFGAFLVFTGVRMATRTGHDLDPESNLVIRLIRRLVPVTERLPRAAVLRSRAGRPRVAAGRDAAFRRPGAGRDDRPDLRRRLDTRHLRHHPGAVHRVQLERLRHSGLRALYFLLADVIHRFHYLKVGLSVVLVFVGLKMLAADLYKVPIGVSLGIIALALGVSTAASWWWPRAQDKEEERDAPVTPEIAQPKPASEP